MDKPERFYNVSQTQMSIARYYGGIIWNDTYYVYNPVDDTLTREDIVKVGKKADKEKAKAAKSKVKDYKDLIKKYQLQFE